MPFDLAKRRLPICMVLIYIVKDPEAEASPQISKPFSTAEGDYAKLCPRRQPLILLFLKALFAPQHCAPIRIRNDPKSTTLV
jgi:hypothetical protein